MPKLPKSFGRRRSTANALEEIQDSPPVQPSFRVFERPDGGSKSFDGGVKLAKYSPKLASYQRHNEDNMFEDLKFNRGSGASNTNTASTTDNSSRLSAASTTPSSTDIPGQEDWRSPHDKPFHDIPIPAVPRSTSAFSLKAAGRTLSFGRGKPSSASPTTEVDEPPPLPRKNSQENFKRERAVTASSYASTAVPPKLEEKELGLSLGGDFAEMFSGFGKRKSAFLDVQDTTIKTQNTDYSSSSPSVPARSYAGNRMNQPSPLNLDHSINVSPSPNSWNSQHSQDGLISNSSPIQGPPVPRRGSPHGQSGSMSTNDSTKPPQPVVSRFSGLARKPLIPRTQPTTDYGDNTDEDARLLKDSVNSLRQLTESPVDIRARDSWLGLLSKSPSYGALPAASTPKSKSAETGRGTPKTDPEGSLFDQQITAAADVAQQYEQIAATPPPELTPKNKVMTPAQFERYRQEQDRLKVIGGQSKDEDNEEDTYDDDEDEAEKQKQVAKQRRKQEAHMAVYRQQMMKVTGEASSSAGAPPMRSSMQHSRSSLNLLSNASGSPEDEEEDEEVPLAILAAHGFPNKNRPPSQLPTMNSNPNLRASSMIGAYPAPQSVAGDPIAGGQGGRLPVFARKLPEDPYFGAGIVNPINRESLALGNGAGSVYGGSSRGQTPGGLIGVIATEERSRAMRRGSPNAAGEYAPPPSNGFNGMGMPPNMQMPPMGRSMTMPNPMGPMGPMGPMLTVGDQAQLEMAAQMQQFMQMQMQFMQMMTSNQGRPQSQNGQSPPMQGLPSMGMPAQQGLRPSSSQGRTMSMLDPNAAPWQQAQRNTMYAPSFLGGGYTPSIAPSERSNVGLPGRYRPVSQYAGPDNSRAATMSGAIQDWSDAKQGVATVKAVKKSGDVSDEDDEEGWEAMKQKREKKKSMWRSQKDDNTSGTMKDLWAYATNSG